MQHLQLDSQVVSTKCEPRTSSLTRECAPHYADAPIITHHEPTHLEFDPWSANRQQAVYRRPSSKTCASRPQYRSTPSHCQASAAVDSEVQRCSWSLIPASRIPVENVHSCAAQLQCGASRARRFWR
ncbi:unnamed protein product [Ectocarpus sp. 12 AP-2014]